MGGSPLQPARLAPELLAEYDAVAPGLGGRVLAMARREEAHRRSMDARDADAAEVSRALALALAAAAAALAALSCLSALAAPAALPVLR